MSPVTVKKYKRQWEHNIPSKFKAHPVKELDVDLFEAIHKEVTYPSKVVRKAYRPVEANRTLDMLSAMLEWVMSRPQKNRMGLKENYAAKVHQHAEGDSRGIWLSDEEQDRLIQFLMDPKNRADAWMAEERRQRAQAKHMKVKRQQRRRPGYILTDTMADALLVIVLTGLRHSEVTSLEWATIDECRNLAKIRQNKQGGKRTEQVQHKRVYLPDEVLEFLERRPRENKYVFPSTGRSKRSATGHIVNLQDAWERLREHLKLPNVRIHDFRHTVACELASHPDGDVKHLQGAMGWASSQTALRYMHARQHRQDQMVQDTASRRLRRAQGEGDGPKGTD